MSENAAYSTPTVHTTVELEPYVTETMLSCLLPILANNGMGFGYDGLLYNEGEQTCQALWSAAKISRLTYQQCLDTQLYWGGTHQTYYNVLYLLYFTPIALGE